MGAADKLPAQLLEITPETAPAIYQGKGLDHFFDQIKALANEVPDLKTKKGRDRIASLAYKVSQSKAAVEKPGRDYLKVVKELPKQIEAELRDFVTKCDALRDEVRRPLDEWEAEQERIAAEQKAAEEAAALAKQFEADHEIALLMDREWERQREEDRRAAEQARIEREAAIAHQAAERAKAEAEAKALAEQEAAKRREIEARLAAERAEAERHAAIKRAEEAERRAEQERIDAAARAEQAAKEAEERAEAARLKAIDDERRRVADEEAARQREAERLAANKEHRRTVNREALNDLVEAAGLNEESARAVIEALARGHVRHINIKY